MRTQVFCSVGLLRATIAPPIPKARTGFGLFYARPPRQCWRPFADLPRERFLPHFRTFGPSRPLYSPLLSGGLASARKAASCIGAGFEAVGCGWQLVGRCDRGIDLHCMSLQGSLRPAK